MPAFVVAKVAQALNEERKPVNGSRVLVVGVAYKRDIDDMRESPALDVMRLLEEDGAEVVFHDPFVAELSRGRPFALGRRADRRGARAGRRRGDRHEPPARSIIKCSWTTRAWSWTAGTRCPAR